MEKQTIYITMIYSHNLNRYIDSYTFRVEATRDEVSKKLREIAEDIDATFEQ